MQLQWCTTPMPEESEGVSSRHLSNTMARLQSELQQQKEEQCDMWRYVNKMSADLQERLDALENSAKRCSSTDLACKQPETDESLTQEPESERKCPASVPCDEIHVRGTEESSAKPAVNASCSSLHSTQDRVKGSETNTDRVKKSRTSAISLHQMEDVIQSSRPVDVSVWEVVAVLGTGCMTYATSIFLWMIMLLTAFFQLTYILIGVEAFNKDWFTTGNIAGLRRWRAEVGHSIQFADHLGKPLVSGICDGDISLPFGTLQLSKKRIIDDYLRGGFAAAGDGTLLCLIALLLWYLSISTHLHTIADFSEAVLKTKRAKKTEIDLTSAGQFKIVSFSQSRVIAVQVLCLMRFAILLSLTWMGTVFIVFTETLVDLIIKALALQAVLNVDSLMFKAVVPLDAATLAKRLQPLPLRSRHRACGLDVRSFLVLFAMPSALAAVYMSLIGPRTQRMQQVRDVLCGGNRSFLVSMDGLGIPHAVIQNSSRGIVRAQYQRDAVQQAIDGEKAGAAMLVWVGSQINLQDVARTTLPEAVLMAQKDFCTDMLAPSILLPKFKNYRALLNAHLPKNQYPPITNCSQVAHLCWNLSTIDLSNLVRLICPSTCGCTDPRSGTLFQRDSPYCAPTCMKTAEFLRRHGQLQCKDMPPAKLREQVWWRRNAERLQWMQAQSASAALPPISSYLLSFGCTFLKLAQTPAIIAIAGMTYNFCDEYSPQARTFWRSACPEACNCTLNFREGCPPKCQPVTINSSSQ